MTAVLRRALRAGLPLAGLLLADPGMAAADHGGALRAAPASPLMVGLIAAAIVLGAGAIVMGVARLLTRRAPRSE